MKTLFSLVVLIVVMHTRYVAQDFEGRIEMSITMESDENMDEMTGLLPSKSTTYIKGHKSRIETSGGMVGQVIIVDEESKKITILMNLMGQKMAMVNPLEEAQDAEAIRNGMKVEYTSEKKTIAGYTCTKAIVTIPGGESEKEITTEVWYSDEIGNFGKEFRGVKGMPMEYAQDMGGTKVTYSATAVVKEKISDELFKIPADYMLTTPEQMGHMFPMMPSED